MSALDHAAAHERIADLALELGALEGLADVPLREHVAQCDQCAAEVADWLAVHGSVGAALAGADGHDVARIAAPAALRERVLERIGPPAPSVVPDFSNWRRVLALAAVALLVVLGAAAVVVYDQRSQLEAAQADGHLLATALASANRILAQPDHWAVPLVAPAGGAGAGTLAWTQHDLVVLAEGLPAPPAGHVYLCWLASPTDTGGQAAPTRIGYMHYVAGQAFWASSLDDWAQIDLGPGTRFLVTLATEHADETGSIVLEGTLPD